MLDTALPRPRSPRRTVLVAPGDNTMLLGKLSRSETDVALIELEDGVHASRKQFARTATLEALRTLNWGEKECVVRINEIGTPGGRLDLEAVVPGAPSAIMLPKIERVGDVRMAAALIEAIERRCGLPEGCVRLWAQVETAKGVVAVQDLLASERRIDGVLLGCGDLSADLNVKRMGIGAFRRPAEEAHELYYSRGHIVAAARAAGIDCFDTASVHLRDLATLRARAEYSAQMGFSGVIVVSPRHVPTAREAFSPSPEDVSWARTIVALAAAHEARREMAFMAADGDLVIPPMVRAARQILDRHEACVSFENRLRARSQAPQPRVATSG